MKFVVLRFVALCALIVLVTAWTKEDHEIFRLRDEVAAAEGSEVTFYDILGIKSSANQDEINQAYRKKSRTIHPDKVKQNFIAQRATKKKSTNKPAVHVNKPPSEKEIQKIVKQANERFGRLGLVTNILRGSGRERYDHFLRNGFPKWRGTGYYYTRFRPGLGTVLLGLFIFGGGAVHYGALVLSYKRQRDFVGRYIRQARRAAWGDEGGIGGIPGLGGAVAPPPPETDSVPIPMNRKQKRQMEKGNKKEKTTTTKRGGARSGTATPDHAPVGQRKRVVAENGKVLIVDSAGNVYLEEEDEDGNVGEFLLDVDEIEKPSIRRTALFRLPIWMYRRATARFQQKAEAEEEGLDKLDITLDYSGQDGQLASGLKSEQNANGNVNGNGNAKRRQKKGGKSS